MPLFDIECLDCNNTFEWLKILSKEVPQCPYCGSSEVKKMLSTFHYRDNPDTVKHELPDPVPPLRELVGKTQEGCEGGYKELQNDQRQLSEYRRRKDKQGNSIWEPIEKTYFDYGKGREN